jgi:hypothetical protein
MNEALMEAERLLRYGMLDRAEAIYRRVADEDPTDAEAVLGLARVASERGDDKAAYRLAARAEGIDPRNDYARALRVRLRDILAAQGHDVAGLDPQPSRPRLLRRLLDR